MKLQNIIVFAIIPLLGFLVDFFSKYQVIQNVCLLGKDITVLPFFNIVCVLNTGVSFGMFAGMKNGPMILFFITLLILIGIYIIMYREHDTATKYAYSIIIAGAFGNIVDRFLRGGVIDFLDFHYNNWHYPAFNVADILIFIGACLIISIHFLKKSRT